MTGTDAISSGMANASIVRLFFIFGTGFVFSFNKCSTRPLDSIWVKIEIQLTRVKWQFLQFLQPLIIDDHRVMLFGLAERRIPGVVGVRNHIAHVLGMHRVEDSEEIRSIWVAILWVFVLQILHDFTISKELGEEVFDTQLIILRNSDKLAFGYWQKGFLSLKNLAHKIAIDSPNGRHIKLDYKTAFRANLSHLRCSLMYVYKSCLELNLVVNSSGQKLCLNLRFYAGSCETSFIS